MFALRSGCFAICVLLLESLTVFAQETKKWEYPDSPEGLQKLMGDLVLAAKTNSAREKLLITSLKLPDASSWFADVFGPENGVKLAASYQKSEIALERNAEGLFRHCADEGLNEIRIDRLGTAGHPFFSDKFLASMVHPVPFYKVSFAHDVTEQATSENYVYVQGGFRLISDDVLIALPGMGTMRIRLAENVIKPKVEVKAVAPSNAAGKPMHGKVLLRVRIDTNGNIKNVELTKGDPVLGQAAADAVRQWQYAPFTVNGTPLEVDTQITVRFP